MAQRERRLARAHAELVTALGREPTADELAAAAELDPAEVAAMAATARVVVSLDAPVGESGDAALGDLLPGPGADAGEEVLVSLEREAVRRAVDALPTPEREVIKRRFGIDGDPQPESHAAIARRLGRSVRDVRFIERRALAYLSQRRELDALYPAA